MSAGDARPDAPPRSLWQSEVALRPPDLEGDCRVDVAIVGAGLSGLWLAHHLRHRGAAVLVLDQTHPAHGASGRNAGFVLAGTRDLYASAVRRLGRTDAREWLELSRLNRRLLEELAKAAPDDIGLQSTGSVYLADPDEAADLRDTVEFLREDGVPASVALPGDLSQALKRLAAPLAAHFPEDGAVHPARLVHQLWQVAGRQGVRIVGHAPVTRVVSSPAGVTLTTPRGMVRAARVVLAVNAWLPQILPEAEEWVRPVRAQVLATAPVDPLYEWPVYASHGYLYWRQRPDGRLIVGGYRHLDPAAEVGYPLVLHAKIQGRLEELAGRIAGGPVEVTHRWAGTMGFSPDHLPFVEEVEPGVHVVGGYSGHGVALTAALAEVLARHLTTGVPIPPILSLTRKSWTTFRDDAGT